MNQLNETEYLLEPDENDRNVNFEFKGLTYHAYERTYSNGDTDIEVYALDCIGEDVDGEVQEYAETLFNGVSDEKL
jgi:hypothetical protein